MGFEKVTSPSTLNVKWNSGGGIVRILLEKTTLGLELKKNNGGVNVSDSVIDVRLKQGSVEKRIAEWDFRYNPLDSALLKFKSESQTSITLNTSTFTDSNQVIGEESASKSTGIRPGKATLVVLDNRAYGGIHQIASTQVTVSGSVPTPSDIHVTSVNPSWSNGEISAKFDVASDIGWGHTQKFKVTITDVSTNSTIHEDTISRNITGSISIGSYNTTSYETKKYTLPESNYGGDKISMCVDTTT